MVFGYIDGMEMYYRTLCGKGAPLGGYFVTPPGLVGGLFCCPIRVLVFVYNSCIY